jgi:hypothetical protein
MMIDSKIRHGSVATAEGDVNAQGYFTSGMAKTAAAALYSDAEIV